MGFDWETILGSEGDMIQDDYDSLVSAAGEWEMREYDRQCWVDDFCDEDDE